MTDELSDDELRGRTERNMERFNIPKGMGRRTRMEAQADLLAEPGIEPHEVTLLAIVDREVRRVVNAAVNFHLVADNIDRPDAAKYGTHPDGKPRYAPAWYVAQSIKTGINEALYGALRDVLSCESVDEHGHVCVGSIGHETNCWDGNGCNWWTSENP